MRALIVDDDPLARRHLHELVAVTGGIEVIGTAPDGREAVDRLATNDVDLVFLDIEMPRLDGFGVIAEVGERMPPVIFTSAYSEFAVRAFEAFALDYLLKPIEPTRFATAVGRARAATRRTSADPRLLALRDELSRTGAHHFPEALAILVGEQYVVTRVADIDWIEAAGSYTRIHVAGQKSRIMTKTLAALERDVLDAAVFVRVHRSAIVNCRRIAAAEARENGGMTLIMAGGGTVECSRRSRRMLESRLYFTA